MRIRIDLKILIFFIVFHFTNQLREYIIIMLFSIIHEIGHIVVALLLKLKVEKIEIMPLGVTAFLKTNFNNNTVKEIFVALAGPITSFVLAILCNNIELKYITVQEAAYSNILIGLFNLIPLYPLDGGRIIKGILHIKLGMIKAEILINKISNIIIIILTIISSIAVYYYRNFAIFIICIFLWWMTLREKSIKTLDILPGK